MISPRTTCRQILRGMGEMAHVGHHPGNTFALMLAAIMILSCARNGGLAGALLGLAGWSLTILPCYAYGAWSRAMFSDHVERRRLATELVNAWVASLPTPPDGSVQIRMQMTREGKEPVFHAWLDHPKEGLSLPEEMTTALEGIMTHSFGGHRKYHFRPDDMRSLIVWPEETSSHARLEAFAVLARHGIGRARSFQENSGSALPAA